MAPEADTTADLRGQILAYFKEKNKMLTMRDVANGLGVDHRTAKQALTELINEGVLEFTSFGGATFIKMAGQ